MSQFINAKNIRKQVLDLAFHYRTAHIGGSLSVVEILVSIFTNFKINKKQINNASRARLLYSKGHACLAYYSALEEFKIIKNLKENFNVDGGDYTSHINHKVDGVEFSTGSLGHALPIACGIATSLKNDKNNAKVICILSDGELNEGSNWEALLYSQHHELSNLLIVIDYNKLQSFGYTNEVINLEPLKSKFESFNLITKQISGHNFEQLNYEISLFISNKNKFPTILICDTIKGKGISFYENKLSSHYRPPNEDEYLKALMEINNAK